MAVPAHIIEKTQVNGDAPVTRSTEFCTLGELIRWAQATGANLDTVYVANGSGDYLSFATLQDKQLSDGSFVTDVRLFLDDWYG